MSPLGVISRLTARRGRPAEAAAPLPYVPPVSTAESDDPLIMSATRLAAAIRQKRLSAREVADLHIARIEATGPIINAVVADSFERARREADALDARAAHGDFAGQLHGVAMTVKDSFDTEGVISTGGTLGRRRFVPDHDATVVARARAAGAILLGKTNTPELTLGGGWKGTDNLVYGLTRNPYDPAYQPGASSGGSAANVAAGGASFDIGTDYGGSLRGPAHACGLAAIKATQGRIPRSGHIIDYGGLFDSFQQVGPIARRVEDLALLMPILSGPDDRDAACAPVPLGDPATVDLNGLRVALALTGDAGVQAMVRRAAGWLEEAGCRVVEAMPPRVAEMSRARAAFSAAPGPDPMRRRLRQYGTTQASPGLYLDGEEAPCGDLTRFAEELDAARSEQLRWIQDYDVVLCAAGHRPALPVDFDPSTFNFGGVSLMGMFNGNGWPAGVVRMAAAPAQPHLPMGVQVAARPWREDFVIAVLSLIESRSGGYRPPEL